MRRIVPLLAAAWISAVAFAQGAVPDITVPGLFVPPDLSKSTVKNGYQLGEDVVKAYREGGATRTVLRQYAGMGDSLPRFNEELGLPIEGRVIEANKTGAELFRTRQYDAPFHVFTAEITSEDAVAVRLLVSLSALQHGEEVWIASPHSGITYGPYYAQDERPGGRWMPRIHGDTALLIVRSVVDEVPQIALKDVGHIFVPMQELEFFGQLPCQVNVNCETDPDVQQLKTGVGILSFVTAGREIPFCTGLLLNNPVVGGDPEPLLLTANHCIPEAVEATSTEVIWDLESSVCNGLELPDLDTLPRSEVECLLATNRVVDGTLLRLAAGGGVYDGEPIPAGQDGRFYAGWTTRAPQVGERVFGIHHPRVQDKKFSEGVIFETGATRRIQGISYEDQIGVEETRGRTEGGSSGSGLYLQDGTNAVVGMLSNGPAVVSCEITGTAYYGSFAAFFPDIEQFIFRPSPPACGDPVGSTVAVRNLRAMPLLGEDRVVVTWQPATQEPSDLVLVTRTDRFPNGIGDGTAITLDPASSNFLHEGLTVGEELFYGLFASFDGVAYGQRDFARVVVGDATGPVTYEPLSEEFDAPLRPFDLAFSQLTFIPLVDFREVAVSTSPTNFMNYSNYRAVYRPGVTRFPVSREGAIALPLREGQNLSQGGANTLSGPGPGARAAFLKLPNAVPFFGRFNRDLVVSSQGFITFNSPADTVSLTQDVFSPLLFPSYETHFAIPRISFLFTDLSPQSGGSAWYRVLDDRVVITFEEVPVRFSFPPRRSSVQTELFYNGQIRFTYLQVNAPGAVVGLSDGKGVPIDPAQFDFVFPGRLESDLSSFSAPAPLQLQPVPILRGLEGETIAFNPSVETQSAGALTYAAVDAPFGLTVNSATGGISWPTTTGDAGVYRFDLVVTQGGLAASQTVTVVVESVTRLPAASAVEVTPAIPTEDDILRVDYDYSHPDGVPEGPSNIVWYRNGQAVVALIDSATVPPAATRPGDRWYAEILPVTISGVEGPAARSNVVFIAGIGDIVPVEGDEKSDADVNLDGVVNALDIQLVINDALNPDAAKSGPRTDINRDGAVNALDVQLVINAVLN